MDKEPKELFFLPGGLASFTDTEIEDLFSVPPAERTAILKRILKDKEHAYLGQTDKTAPELAVDLIKKGVKAKSYGGTKNATRKPV